MVRPQYGLSIRVVIFSGMVSNPNFDQINSDTNLTVCEKKILVKMKGVL